jgi:AAA15 family ATPase/GTPase
MQDIFVSKIHINEVRHIRDFEIRLSETERKHLIITGKNGSGKTSLLDAISSFGRQIENGDVANYDRWADEKSRRQTLVQAKQGLTERDRHEFTQQINELTQRLSQFGGVEVFFNVAEKIGTAGEVIRSYHQKGEFIIKFFVAKRNAQLREPSGVQKVTLQSVYPLVGNAGVEFYQYIVNLKADRSFARDESDEETVKKVDEWFNNFSHALSELFDSSDLKLEFDRKNYRFNIRENGKAPYTLNQLSDGYSAILDIVTELIMRMEEHRQKSYDVQGVVLIDEIETHLHVDLQKKILPFLTAFFPKIQFIVTTHSPFVLNSVSNAVICDLEKRIVTEDLSGYSYDTILESYFEVDKYSAELKKKVEEYERLEAKEALTDEEQDELRELARYLDDTPKFLATELAVKLQQIKLRRIGRRNQ